MSSELNDVVRVVIFDQTTAIATASFQIPLVLATFTNFSERTRTYTSIAGVGSDFVSTDKAYILASKLFGQSGVLGAQPPSIVIGRRQVNSVTITPTVANSSTYTVTINGIAYNFTSDATATAAEITAGLDAAIGSPTGVTATDNIGTLTVAVTTPGTAWSIKVSSNLVKVDAAATETWPDALTAVEAENDTWYGLVAETQVNAEQEALSDAIQAREKIYGISSADIVAPTTGTTDIGYELNAKSAARTFGVYLPTAATEFPEAAWMGSQLAVTPGANDWDFKRANGVTRSMLTSTQVTNLKNKSWNYYRRKAGVDIFQDGNMFDKKPIDQMKVA
jgi:phage tail sheath gpL-like